MIKNNIKNRCGKIGFMKFIFALAILAQHTNAKFPGKNITFGAGSAAVEFFFIVSGYLLCKKYINYKNNGSIGDTTLSFLFMRIKRFLPYVIFLLIISLPFQIYLFNYTELQYASIIYTLFYLPVKSTQPDIIFQIFWYISAMIIAETITVPFLLKYKDNFAKIVSPIISFFLIGYILIKWGVFPNPWALSIICYKGIIRAFAMINLGCFLYVCHEKTANIQYTKLAEILLTLLENIGYISIIFLMNVKNAHSSYGLLMVVVFSICILLSFSNKLHFNSLFNNAFFYKLEEISLPLYVNQFLILYTIQRICINRSFSLAFHKAFLLSALISIVLAIIELGVLKLYNKYSSNVKKLFIKA